MSSSSIAYSNDFNAGANGFTFASSGTNNATSVFQWSASPTYASIAGDGTPMIRVAGDAINAAKVNIATSPSFSLAGYSSATLTFNQTLRSSPSEDTYDVVQYSTDGGTTWTTMGSNQAGIDNNTGGTWSAATPQMSIALPAGTLGATNVKIRFYQATSYGYWWDIDNIVVTGISSTTPSYSWSPVGGASGLSCTACGCTTITPTAAGVNMYSVTATSSGCTASAIVTVNVTPLPSVGSTGGGAICSGNSATLSGTGATSYSWTGGITNGVAFTPSTGVNTYTVTGTTGSCTNTATATVTVNANPTVGSTGGGIAICSGNSATLSGTGATSYSWTGGITNGVAFTPSVGINTYTVTGTTGSCTNTATATVTVNANPTVGSTGGGIAICSGNSATLSGTGATSYSWTGGISNGVAFTPSVGVNTYTVTGTTGSCSNTATATVTVNANPSVGSTGSGAICSGNSATLSGTGATSYSWTGGITNGVAFTPFVGVNNYTVTGTTGSCSATATATVTVNANPTVGTTGGGAICSGNTATLSGTGATSYSWTGGISNGVAFTPSVGVNTYTVTGTDANSCTNTATAAVTVNTTPTVGSTGGGIAICSGNSATLSGTGATSYSWTGGITNGVAFIPSTTTTYTVTGTTGSCSNTATTTVTVNSLPSIVMSPSATPSVCIGSSVPYCADIATVAYSNDFNTGANGFTFASSGTNNATSVFQWSTSPTYDGIAGDGTSMIRVAGDAVSGYKENIATSPSFSLAGYSAATLTFNETLRSSSYEDTYDVVQYSTDGGTTWTTMGSNQAGIDNNTGGTWSAATPQISIAVPAGALGAADVKIRFYQATSWGYWWDIDNIVVSGVASSTPSFTWSPVGGASGLSCTACSCTTITPTATGANVYSVTATSSGCSASTIVTVNVNPLPTVGTTGGGIAICSGNTATLSGTGATSYSWTGGITDATPFTPATGANTYTVTGTDANGCSNTATAAVTVNPLPAITASSSASGCSGAPRTLTATGGISYTWSPSADLSATTGATVTATPSATSVYTVTGVNANGCSNTATVTVNISALPDAGTINGTLTVCTDLTTALTDATPGVSWSSSNAAVATVNGGGVVTGISAGTSVITYTSVPGTCGSGISTVVVTVNARPAPITGPSAVCVGYTIALGDTTAGGSWVSSMPAHADIDASGTVSGLSGGTTMITYVVPNGCYRTASVMSNIVPVAISGASTVCVGATSVATDGTMGGYSWTSTDTTVATIGYISGVMTGISAGTTTITYTLSTGCYITTVITANPAPAGITGSNTLCAGATSALADMSTGGTWSSSNTARATAGSSSGIVTGVAAGTATITYTLATGCTALLPVTVNPQPSAITGSATVCIGSASTLTASPAGGTWSSDATGVATAGSTGIVTGYGTGMATISYTLSAGCASTAVVTVSSLGAISGPSSVCVGSPATFTAPATGGTWSSSNTAVASVSTAGVVSGFAAGVVNITYTVSGGCRAVATVTVNTALPNITGPNSVCIGSAITLVNTVTGGTWSTSGSFVTVDATTGVVTGASAGTATVTYTAGSGCFKTYAVTAKALPSAIGGTTVVCVGSTVTLTNTTAGSAAWSSSTTSVATIVSGSGVLTGVAPGTATISYTLATGCYTTTVVSVNAVPSIAGPAALCAGTTAMLSCTLPGGTWASSATSVATIGSASGVLTAVAAGASTITYSATGCRATRVVTVNAQPAAIIGAGAVCIGSTSALTSGTSGGAWSSLNTSAATVGATGIVSGISADTATIVYTLSSGCYRTSVVTVSATPVISGATSVCTGSSVTLTSLPSGGTWSSSTTGVATIGATSGVLSGVAAGAATITYTRGAGCRTTIGVTVGTSTAAITGAGAVCSGSAITLSDATPSGVWSSSNPAIATVSSTGVVTALSSGTVVITYSIAGGCYATKSLNVGSGAVAVTGDPGMCTGINTTFTASITGSSWSSSNTSIVTIGTVSGVATGVSAGIATITFTPYTTGSYAGCITTVQVTVDASVSLTSIVGTPNVGVGAVTMLSDATAGGVWASSNTSQATVSGGAVSGIAAGFPVISYTVTHGACRQSVSVVVHVTAARPGAAVAAATTDILRVYPNPTNGMFTVDAPSAGTFTVYTLEGKELMSNAVAEGTNAFSLPGGTAAGIYMCRYMGADGATATVRLVYAQ